MEAPRGVEVSAEKGPLGVSGRKDLQLESTEGEVSPIGLNPLFSSFQTPLSSCRSLSSSSASCPTPGRSLWLEFRP